MADSFSITTSTPSNNTHPQSTSTRPVAKPQGRPSTHLQFAPMPPLPKLTSATEGGKKRSISALHGSHNGAVSIPDRQAKALKKGPGAIPASASGPGFLERYIWGCSSAPRDVVNKIELDTQGDLWLLIRAAPNQADNFIGVRVASTFLRMASTVWAEQLQKNKKLEDMKLEAEDDDPEALLFVLRAIHLRATELPKQLTFDEVVKVAVVCAKYDAVATVNWKLFIRDRIDNFAKAAGTSKDFEDGTDAPLLKWYLAPGKEEWAFVAWTFGFASDFITLAKYLIRTGRTDGKGNLLNSKGHEMNGNFPPGMIGMHIPSTSPDSSIAKLKHRLHAPSSVSNYVPTS
ncbi:hypothetical protein BU16DRAFT_319884 [Lophium mytilinum]|uniref:BTB domain-containing protein n=1 Tax=Lophium mytilinum TaxID=390894 RepID=A0A6A6QZU0_9PEZI|nr:hypothetical protein BU16DRAFT_319884 [Lophium mytilinum]